MKKMSIVFLIMGGFLVVLIVSAMNRNQQIRYNGVYSPGAQNGSSAGGIITSISNGFLSLFNAGVFGTGWGKDKAADNLGGVGSGGGSFDSSDPPGAWV